MDCLRESSGGGDTATSYQSLFPLREELILAGCEVQVGRETYDSSVYWQ